MVRPRWGTTRGFWELKLEGERRSGNECGTFEWQARVRVLPVIQSCHVWVADCQEGARK